MGTEVKDVAGKLLHFHFNNVEEHRGGGPMVQMDKASLREANDLFVAAYNALRAAESRATAAEGRVALLEEALGQHERVLLVNAVRQAAQEASPIWLEHADDLAARARLAKEGQ